MIAIKNERKAGPSKTEMSDYCQSSLHHKYLITIKNKHFSVQTKNTRDKKPAIRQRRRQTETETRGVLCRQTETETRAVRASADDGARPQVGARPRVCATVNQLCTAIECTTPGYRRVMRNGSDRTDSTVVQQSPAEWSRPDRQGCGTTESRGMDPTGPTAMNDCFQDGAAW